MVCFSTLLMPFHASLIVPQYPFQCSPHYKINPPWHPTICTHFIPSFQVPPLSLIATSNTPCIPPHAPYSSPSMASQHCYHYASLDNTSPKPKTLVPKLIYTGDAQMWEVLKVDVSSWNIPKHLWDVLHKGDIGNPNRKSMVDFEALWSNTYISHDFRISLKIPWKTCK
jgi:hypothetical protein